MAQVSSDHVIKSLREQLSDAHLKIAVLEAQLMEVGMAQLASEPMPVIPGGTGVEMGDDGS